MNHKSSLLYWNTKWSTNPACYMEHSDPQIQPVTWNTKWFTKPLLYGTQTVIHKSSPLHGTQSDPQIQPATWNTKLYTNPVCYMEHKQWSTNPACYMEHKQWSTNQAHYTEHKVIHKSSPLYGTQTVIHKSSPLHGTQSDPQFQSIIWNTMSVQITSPDSDNDVGTHFSTLVWLHRDTRIT